MGTKSGFQPGFVDVETLTASKTITDKGLGKLYISGAVDVVLSLPPVTAANKGLTVTSYTATLSTSTGFSFSPSTLDKIQGATVAGVALASGDNKDLINTAATDVAGDGCELTSDGVDGWLVTKLKGVWASEA